MPKNQTHCCKFNQQVIQHTLYFLQTGAFLPPTQRTTALY
ncbi:hypothetical protein PAGA_a1397 [Pseudoalteromonas agarivorans DSM 14585]|uniref:Uncharacterized protein n=1 Tax=Pseudoalteromonas agarivorans DSM 14585 TaxID=1312369 RepID=A0ACA8DUI7_9GAMM|nr:hypothetical protein PAGA_a1397 [Pseudoalteromonas agarivorans DSM 14585]